MKSIMACPGQSTCRHLVLGIVAAFALFALLSPAVAAYPDKPIRWIVPSTPGGGTDTTTRIVVPKLSEILGQPIVIENRPGASGNIGVAVVAKAAPDGYTLGTCIASNTSNVALQKQVPFDLTKDFSPVTLLVTLPNALVVHPSLPAKNVKELVSLAKSKPGKLEYSSGGLGSIQHMSMELFQNMTGTKILHVPYKATHPALTDAVSGYVPITVASSLTTLPLVRSGRLRALGVTSAQRSEAAPDIPTIAEQGVPGYEAVQWFGVLAPAGTPPDIVLKVHAAILKALQDPGVKKHFSTEGADITPSKTPDDFGALIRRDVAKWRKVVQESGIKVE
ncbi:MAG: Bug family tripartite tricarboxylate transporter substrate binding protein [Syntrophales bacterium]